MLVDDHEVVRQGLRRVLENEGGFKVVGEAKNGLEAVKQALSLLPDVIVMDLHMPQMDGIQATREIKKKLPDVAVLALTMYADDLLPEGVDAGIGGFMLKDGDSHQIAQAIQQIHQGINPVSPALNKKLLTEYYRLHKQNSLALTNRQKEILKLVCEGFAITAICHQLCISLSTQKREMREIYNKLGVNSRAHACSIAIKAGIIKIVHD
ncbi:DNA-binding response regulator LuxR family [Dehalogenimonas sp. WBC-2]|nr:DNA-binding response regulator LuxR family [Dehalogenimonas sp. WBC-2]